MFPVDRSCFKGKQDRKNHEKITRYSLFGKGKYALTQFLSLFGKAGSLKIRRIVAIPVLGLLLCSLISTQAALAAPKTFRASVSTTGGDPMENGIVTAGAENPGLSSSGRYVAFVSPADNLVAGDVNGHPDLFVRDLTTGITKALPIGGLTPAFGHSCSNISGNGNTVVFYSFDSADLVNQGLYVYVYNLTTGVTKLIPHKNITRCPNLSSNGRFIAFSADPFSLEQGAFVYDLQTNKTIRLSNMIWTWESPSISANGRYVAFETNESLVASDQISGMDIYVRDLKTGINTLVSVDNFSIPFGGIMPSISANGSIVAFTSDLMPEENIQRPPFGFEDVFIHSLLTHKTQRVTANVFGTEAASARNAKLSSDGSFVAFWTNSTGLKPVGNGYGDIFVRNMLTGVTQQVSVDNAGNNSNGSNGYPNISANGRFVSFWSSASNLVPGDNNNNIDVFVRRLW